MPLLKPKLPLPEPLRGVDQNSFANHTVVKRLPDIARRVLLENQLQQSQIEQINGLIDEIPFGTIRPLKDTEAMDKGDWDQYVQPYLTKNWLEVPWFFAEEYFYRRVLEAVGFFSPGQGKGLDPFSYQKQQSLVTTQNSIKSLAENVGDWKKNISWETVIERLLHIDLWGNQADMSLWTADEKNQPRNARKNHEDSAILIDDTPKVIELLSSTAGENCHIDLIADNAGFELVCDLMLIHALLDNDLASRVNLHLKAHPTFISDAMIDDVNKTITYLTANKEPNVCKMGNKLRMYVESGRLALYDHLFWTSPLNFWELPEDLLGIFESSSLIISKGDANYRRFLGDLHWKFNTPFSEIVSYFPPPLVALRILKSEVMTDLDDERIKKLVIENTSWLTCGLWGLIRFKSK